MSFIKSKLKLARDSIGKKEFSAARDAANQILEYEPENYTAHVFLGLALLNLGQLDESEQIYRKAIELSPDQILAWQGLSQFYEHVGKQVELLETLETLCQLHAKADDSIKLGECINKIIGISRDSNDRLQLIKTLSYLLPDSPFHATLSRLPPPDPTNPTVNTIPYVQNAVYNELPVLEEIVNLSENQENLDMEREIDRRRMRLGSGSPDQIRKEVGKEIWAQSRLPYLYNQILNHPNTSDELRRKTESTLLRYKTRYLRSLPNTDEYAKLKSALREEVDELVRGVILLKIPDEFAWTLYMEEQDHETMDEYDFPLMKQMIQLLPDSVLARVFIGYFRYIGEPISDQEDEKSIQAEPGNEDPFDAIMNAFSVSQDSALICRILGEFYLKEEDHENASKVAKSGLVLLGKLESDSGRNLPRTRVGFQAILATALVHLFPPKHHSRALPIVQEALSTSPNNIKCLFAYAYILQTAEEWERASDLFTRIASLLPDDPENGLRAKEEEAWCHWQATNDENDIERLKVVSNSLDDLMSREHDIARCLWRIGKCFWHLGGKRREEAYSYFINALKRDSSFAPAFTSLGFYYEEIASPPDPVRSSKCFQKAFELDPREYVAARKLAEGFAEDQEWDLVEVVARRTVEGEGDADFGMKESESSVNRFVPRNAWAWKAIGTVEMSHQRYAQAIQAFQVALRAEAEDSMTWLRLGEAYSQAGRHAAAIKALNRALELDPENWLCSFLIGKLKHEIGLAQEAILTFEGILNKHENEVSVLAALAQAHLSLGQIECNESYHERAEMSFLNAIGVAIMIIGDHPGFRGLAWKVISDATFRLSERPAFQDNSRVDQTCRTLKTLLLAEYRTVIKLPALSDFESSLALTFLGISIYVCSLRLELNTSGLARGSAWYDLAVALQLWINRTSSLQPEAEKVIIEAATNALREEPSNDLYWNAFGNAHFSARPKVAQHAYIRALELDSKSVIAWTNLGFLYYYHGDLELSNEAFFRAQVNNPDYALAWLGQALVAIANGHHSDAQALLDHATTTLVSIPPDVNVEFATRFFHDSRIPRRRTERKMDLIPCFFALDRYCARRPGDASGLHLFSLICERIGHIDMAIDLVTRSIRTLEAIYEESEDATVERQFTIANSTLGRLLLSAGDCERSIECFQNALGLLSAGEGTSTEVDAEIKILRVQAYLGLALAHFRIGNYQGSLNGSQEALEIAGDDLSMKGPIMVVFAQTLWALGTDDMRETAKSRLLEYIAIDPENLTAINALAGMGILTGDESLVDAALSEILGLPISRRQELDVNRDVDYLLVQHHLSQGKIHSAVSISQKEVVSEPGKPEPRIQLARLMIQKGEHRGAAALLADVISGDKGELSSVPAALVLHAIALSSLDGASTEEKKVGLRELQRAIMLQPSSALSWRALAYARSCSVR